MSHIGRVLGDQLDRLQQIAMTSKELSHQKLLLENQVLKKRLKEKFDENQLKSAEVKKLTLMKQQMEAKLRFLKEQLIYVLQVNDDSLSVAMKRVNGENTMNDVEV